MKKTPTVELPALVVTHVWNMLVYRMNRFKMLVKMASAIFVSFDLRWRKRQAFRAFLFKNFSVV